MSVGSVDPKSGSSSGTSEFRCSLTSLNSSVVYSVLAPYLSLSCVVTLCTVNRSYRTLIDSEATWKHLFRRSFTPADVQYASASGFVSVLDRKSSATPSAAALNLAANPFGSAKELYRVVSIAAGDNPDSVFLPRDQTNEQIRKRLSPADAAVLDDSVHRLMRFVILPGGSGVGKSSIYSRLNGHNPFPSVDISTMIGEVIVRTSLFAGRKWSLQFWDLRGGERARDQTEIRVFRSMHVFFFTYAVDDRRSFNGVRAVHERLLPYRSGNKLYVLVGNKTDLRPNKFQSPKQALEFVTAAEGKAMADELKLDMFIEISAKENRNLIRLIRRSVNWFLTRVVIPDESKVLPPVPQRVSRCGGSGSWTCALQ